MDKNRDIDDIVETLRIAKSKDNGKGCTLLIGAGCSVKAGVPSANGIVDFIKEKYPNAYRRATEKTYVDCMTELSLTERRDLIAGFIKKAKVNWAHICIAQLMKNGYVDRVLTVNFDPLVLRASALIDQFPAVYDFGASQQFKAAYIPTPAVFYLHGQHTGFVLMNTKKELSVHAKFLTPVFNEALQGRTCLVVGYSGNTDPVFDHLAKVKTFENNLYWVNYKDEPDEHVRKRLLVDDKYAFIVKKYDADDFFVELAQKLGCFPPDFIDKPFSHLDSLLNNLTQYSLPGQSKDIDVTSLARSFVQDAKKEYEEKPSALKAQHYLMAGDYEKAISLLPKNKKYMTTDLSKAISWAYTMQSSKLLFQAKKKTGKEADKLFKLARENYKAALKINPEAYEVLYNFGNALSEQAKHHTGKSSDNLFRLAEEKYKAALNIQPRSYETLNNLGITFFEQAKLKTGKESVSLFKLAEEKFRGALKVKSNSYEAMFNFGNALSEQAKFKNGQESDRLFKLAGEKYKIALKLKPESSRVSYNWGTALFVQANKKTGKAAYKLFVLAGEKFEAAVNEKPDKNDALYNLGSTFFKQANLKTGKESDRLLKLAAEKFEVALKIIPNDSKALYGLGGVFSAQARLKVGIKADKLFVEAEKKFLKAESISPGYGSYNLACLCALRAEVAECRKWLKKSYTFGDLPSLEYLLKDSDLNNVREKEWFKNFLKKLKK